MLRLVVALGVTCCAGAAAAEPVKMTREEIQRDLVGALFVVDTPLGTTIPIRISTDGMLAGKAGVLAPMLGAAKDRGRWWLERDQICMKWFRWFDAKARCISLQREANRILWKENSGESGTATLVEAAEATGAEVEAHASGEEAGSRRAASPSPA